MPLLEILKFPDPRLRITGEPVTQIDDEIRQIVANMYETMYHINGIGLAATQVNIHKRFFTMNVSGERDKEMVVFNPEIISKEGIQYESEGCLSVGDNAYDKVERAYKVRLRGMDINGKLFEMDAEGLMAACIQHETDHLNGVLFIDHLSRLKQDRIKKKIEKEQRRK